LKIGIAKTCTLQREVSALQSLTHCGASEFILNLLDVFTHHGPNGSHLCIVTELLGPSLETVVADYHCGGDRLDSKDIIRVAKQILQAVAATHEAGYAHGGTQIICHDNDMELITYTCADISSANICFTASKLTLLPDSDILDVIGHPEPAKVARKDAALLEPGLPHELVRKAGWDDWTDEDEEDVRLVDWGESFPIEEIPARLAQPSDLRAPETIFTKQFDHRVDLWRAGCVVSCGSLLTRENTTNLI
jgi:serine/threonine protein kinase